MTMVGTKRVIFYQLSAKYMEREEDIPPESKEVMYYSLAIGHHIGVFDCFKPQLKCSADLYDRIIEALPETSEARRKFAGLHKFGEIIVDATHTKMLLCGDRHPPARCRRRHGVNGSKACAHRSKRSARSPRSI